MTSAFGLFGHTKLEIAAHTCTRLNTGSTFKMLHVQSQAACVWCLDIKYRPFSQPPPQDSNLESVIDSSTSLTSESSTLGLHHLIPNDTTDNEPNYRGTTSSISLATLFDFKNLWWAGHYNRYAQNHLSDELELCELLNQDSATAESAEVDVDEMTGEILTG